MPEASVSPRALLVSPARFPLGSLRGSAEFILVFPLVVTDCECAGAPRVWWKGVGKGKCSMILQLNLDLLVGLGPWAATFRNVSYPPFLPLKGNRGLEMAGVGSLPLCHLYKPLVKGIPRGWNPRTCGGPQEPGTPWVSHSEADPHSASSN